MVRKVIAGQELLKASGAVMGALVFWLGEGGYIDGTSADQAGDRAREATGDLPRADRLGTLLHGVTDQAPAIDPDDVDDEDWSRTTVKVVDVQPGKIWLENGVGPIAVPRKASDLARPDWSALVTAARIDKRWYLLEIGVVYP
jgi:hypothetical protein